MAMIKIVVETTTSTNTFQSKCHVTLGQLHELLQEINVSIILEVTISTSEEEELKIIKLPNGKFKFISSGDIPRVRKDFLYMRQLAIVFERYFNNAQSYNAN